MERAATDINPIKPSSSTCGSGGGYCVWGPDLKRKMKKVGEEEGEKGSAKGRRTVGEKEKGGEVTLHKRTERK